MFQLLIPDLFQLVMDCIQGGPADRAGIHEGDELVEIDGIYFFVLFIFLVITQAIRIKFCI